MGRRDLSPNLISNAQRSLVRKQQKENITRGFFFPDPVPHFTEEFSALEDLGEFLDPQSSFPIIEIRGGELTPPKIQTPPPKKKSEQVCLNSFCCFLTYGTWMQADIRAKFSKRFVYCSVQSRLRNKFVFGEIVISTALLLNEVPEKGREI